MKKVMMTLAVLVLVLSNLFGHSLMNVMADSPEPPVRERCYKSITIEKGDSLWAIAGEYCHDMNISVSSYVEELKRMNGLKEDAIHAGNRLTVVYLMDAE